MSFNASAFLSTTSQSVTSRLAGTAESAVLGKAASLLGGTDLTSIAGALLTSGSSSSTISSLASLKIDNLVDTVSSDFFQALGITTGASATLDTDSTSSLTNNQGNLTFPPDLGEYYMQLQFCDYSRPTPMAQAQEKNSVIINLPLPSELQDNQNINLSDKNLGLAGTLADALAVSMNNSATFDQKTQAIEGAVGTTVAKGLAEVVNKLGGTTLVATASETLGIAINDNPSVIFGGPSLRTYSMSWKFHPNNAQESTIIKNIIQQLRKSSLPTMTFANSVGVLSYPQVVQCTTFPNEWIKYKKALLAAVNVSFANGGPPVFFEGTQEPVFVQLTLTFKEIEYLLSSDYGGSTGSTAADLAAKANSYISGIQSAASSAGLSLSDFSGDS